MRDSEVVASIVARDPKGLAAAYDRYADDLFGYCRSMLREPADAADAVQDTFVIAASKLAGLRDPERLRAWLFAVARNECLHRLRARPAVAPPLQDITEQADDSVDIAGHAERAETRALVRAAVGGLNAGERDLIAQLWHGLDVAEVAHVLGVSRNHAYSLFSRARDQLEASVGALLVGRAGRRDCPALDSLLRDWDGRMTVLIRKRVHRHIDRCAICADRQRHELHPAVLLALTPGALLGMAAARAALQAAARAALPGLSPAAVRDQVLQLATGQDAHAVAYRATVGTNGHSFGLSGFPRQGQPGHLGMLRLPHTHLAAAGSAVVAAATAGVVVIAVHVPSHASRAGQPQVTAQVSGVLPAGSPAGRTRPGQPSAAATTAAGPTRSGTATPTVPASGTATPVPSPTVTGGPPTPAPTATATGQPTPTVSVSSSGPVVSGSLTVSPTVITLSPPLGGTITLTANGGPVTWAISEPSSLNGKLLLSQTAGTLAGGQSTTVQLTVTGLATLDTALTVTPGPTSVTVLLGLG